jgi:hypothetical protein
LTFNTYACLKGTIGKGFYIEEFLGAKGITFNRYYGVNYLNDSILFKVEFVSKLVLFVLESGIKVEISGRRGGLILLLLIDKLEDGMVAFG